MSSLDPVETDYWIQGTTNSIKNSISHELSRPSTVRPTINIVYGPMGCGKSTHIARYELVNPSTYYVNYDEVIATHPAFEREIERETSERRSVANILKLRAVYDECRTHLRSIDDEIYKVAVQERMDVLWQSTGVDVSGYEEAIKSFKNHGYVVKLTIILVPLLVVLQRLRKRSRETQQLGLEDEQLTATHWRTCYANVRTVCGLLDSRDTVDVDDNGNQYTSTIAKYPPNINFENVVNYTNNFIRTRGGVGGSNNAVDARQGGRTIRWGVGVEGQGRYVSGDGVGVDAIGYDMGVIGRILWRHQQMLAKTERLSASNRRPYMRF